MTDDEVLQLAMYTAAIDAKRFGAEYQPGVFRPTWEDRGPAGQEAYIADARTQFEAVETIQSVRRKNTTPDLDATLKALGQSRARFGDMEQRALAAEATCQHPFAILKFDGGRRAIVCNTCWQIVTHLAAAETGDNR